MNKTTYLYQAIRVRTFYACLTTLLLMVVPFRLTSAALLDLVLPSQAPSQVYKNKEIIEIGQSEAQESALIGIEGKFGRNTLKQQVLFETGNHKTGTSISIKGNKLRISMGQGNNFEVSKPMGSVANHFFALLLAVNPQEKTYQVYLNAQPNRKLNVRSLKHSMLFDEGNITTKNQSWTKTTATSGKGRVGQQKGRTQGNVRGKFKGGILQAKVWTKINTPVIQVETNEGTLPAKYVSTDGRCGPSAPDRDRDGVADQCDFEPDLAGYQCDRCAEYTVDENNRIVDCAVPAQRDKHYIGFKLSKFTGRCVQEKKFCDPGKVPNGVGMQSWNTAFWGACEVVSCDAGYTLAHNACTKTVCTDPNASLCSAPDTAIECNSGYTLKNGACVIPEAGEEKEPIHISLGQGSCGITSNGDIDGPDFPCKCQAGSPSKEFCLPKLCTETRDGVQNGILLGDNLTRCEYRCDKGNQVVGGIDSYWCGVPTPPVDTTFTFELRR